MSFRSDDEAAGWLGAFIDGEGCVYMSSGVNPRTGRKWTNRLITTTVTDLELIEAMAEACDRFGIRYARSERPGRMSPDGSKQYRRGYVLNISAGHALRRFHEVVTLRHAGEVEKLQQILDSFEMKGRCSGCGEPWNDETPGCENCRTRHKYRRRVRPDGLVRQVG